jgi:hypothetical protein
MRTLAAVALVLAASALPASFFRAKSAFGEYRGALRAE